MVMTLRLAACLYLVWMAVTLDASDRIAMRVNPAMCFAPAFIDVRVTIEPDEDNRTLEIVADSIDFYRSSRITLEGNRAPRVFVHRLRNLPGGEYWIEGILSDARGHTVAATKRRVTVVPSGSE